MTKTLKISFQLKNAYRVNSIIYSLKQIPIIKNILPATLYKSKGLKIFAQFISILMEVGSVFIGKAIYMFLMIMIPLNLYKGINEVDAYTHMLLLLTIIGLMQNTNMFNPNKEKYYAIVLMRMNAKEYTLASYGYYIFKIIVGFMPFSIMFVLGFRVPLLFAIIMPFCIAGGKMSMAALYLARYKKRGILKNENKSSYSEWALIIALLVFAYGGPAINWIIPGFLSMGLMILMIPAGLLAIGAIASFEYYTEINKEILNDETRQTDSCKVDVKKQNEGNITDSSLTSDKKGLEYLNDLFVKRHKKILWQATKRITAIVSGIFAVGTIVIIAWPETKEIANHVILSVLPPVTFFMYAFNRGQSYTSALFMNCDHSMLTYPFFKNSESILKLFQLRLRVLIKMNLIPGICVGAGLCWILWLSGGTESVSTYLIILITVIAMSVFFSIHYLTIYYLLQPYNARTEMKSGMYTIVTGVTYFLCYLQINLDVPLKIYGLLWIGFSIFYNVIACMLVYKFAPKTFRIRV